MENVRLGRTEMMVSRLGFGGIPIQRLSKDDAVTVIKRCLELGINYIDTANGYTISEECIGRAISRQRDNLILATKSGSWFSYGQIRLGQGQNVSRKFLRDNPDLAEEIREKILALHAPKADSKESQPEAKKPSKTKK